MLNTEVGKERKYLTQIPSQKVKPVVVHTLNP